MLTKIGLAIGGIIVALLGVIALQPAEYTVVRTIQVGAAPADVHAVIDDFHKWDGWSPWAKLDPNMKTTYSGAPAGTGAIYEWSSPMDNVGDGRMTITNSVPAQRVDIKLEFIKPFASIAQTVFTTTPASGGTQVEWKMSGQKDFMTKAVALFMGGMDKMIGPDFEKGLAQMKALAEKK